MRWDTGLTYRHGFEMAGNTIIADILDDGRVIIKDARGNPWPLTIDQSVLLAYLAPYDLGAVYHKHMEELRSAVA